MEQKNGGKKEQDKMSYDSDFVLESKGLTQDFHIVEFSSNFISNLPFA